MYSWWSGLLCDIGAFQDLNSNFKQKRIYLKTWSSSLTQYDYKGNIVFQQPISNRNINENCHHQRQVEFQRMLKRFTPAFGFAVVRRIRNTRKGFSQDTLAHFGGRRIFFFCKLTSLELSKNYRSIFAHQIYGFFPCAVPKFLHTSRRGSLSK